jgi:hypothetical protein
MPAGLPGYVSGPDRIFVTMGIDPHDRQLEIFRSKGHPAPNPERLGEAFDRSQARAIR